MPGFFARLFGAREMPPEPSAPEEIPTIFYGGLLDALRDVGEEVGFSFNAEDYAKRQKVEVSVRGYNNRDEYPDFDFIPEFDDWHAEECDDMTRFAFTGMSDHQEEIFWRLLNRAGWKKIRGGRVDCYTEYMISGENPYERKIEEAEIYGVEVIDFWEFVAMALRRPVDWKNDRNTQISEWTLERLKGAGALEDEVLHKLTEEDAKMVLSEFKAAA